MSNFVDEFLKGKNGVNKGLPLGPGLSKVSRAINGIQRGMMYTIASSPKVGKSTFVNYGFVIHPYLYALEHNINVTWIYFSYEMDRVSMEFDFACYFLFHDYGLKEVTLPEGVYYKDSSIMPISPQYLRGQMQDDMSRSIIVNNDVEELLKLVYKNRIIPLFGEHDSLGRLLKKGKIEFYEQRENPTGIQKKLLAFAKERGQFITQKFTAKDGNEYEKMVGYTPNDPKEYVIIIYDTIRKLQKERNFNMKETIDKMIEYSVEIRNLCKYIFIPIIHLNRAMTDVQRMKYMGDMLFPASDDVKDSGNLAEECNYLFTLFNPNDERYNLDSHFGKKIRDKDGNELYPNMRSIHLVESRHCSFPQHFRVEMEGNIKNFKQLDIIT